LAPEKKKEKIPFRMKKRKKKRNPITPTGIKREITGAHLHFFKLLLLCKKRESFRKGPSLHRQKERVNHHLILFPEG